MTWEELRELLSTYTLRLRTGDGGAFSDDLRKLVLALLELNVSERQCSNVLQVHTSMSCFPTESSSHSPYLHIDTGSV